MLTKFLHLVAHINEATYFCLSNIKLKLKRPLVVFATIFSSLCQVVYGQFIPYSQYHNVPLLTNPAAPALTRYTTVEIHYRRSRIAHYDVPAVSFMYPFRSKELSSGGLGINVISQHAGPGGMYKVTGATAAFAYAIHLSKTHHISAGISGGVINKRIDASGITTDSQYNLGIFDPSISHGEDFRSGSVTKPVINAGLYWVFTGPENQEKASLGVAAYNMNRPAFALFPDSPSEEMTYIITGDITLRTRGRVTLSPTFRYIWQGTSIANIGGRVIYAANADNKISIGAWYKTTNALVFSAQYNSKAYSISASTDLSIASGRDANVNNAVEIGLGWRMHRKENVNPVKTSVRREKRSVPKRKLSSARVTRKAITRANRTKDDETGIRETASRIEIIYFDSASAVVPVDRIPFLEDLASGLKSHPKTKLKVTGHSCTHGDETVNKQISNERAKAVAKILIDNGVPADQINVVAMGTRKPVGSNRTKAGRQKNRRVEFEWIKVK
jgi:type IX secretion system PorP/SprF family membrane protein